MSAAVSCVTFEACTQNAPPEPLPIKAVATAANQGLGQQRHGSADEVHADDTRCAWLRRWHIGVAMTFDRPRLAQVGWGDT